jgi:hypothetical protein
VATPAWFSSPWGGITQRKSWPQEVVAASRRDGDRFSLPAKQKSRRLVFFLCAFRKRFSLGLEGAGSGVDYFGNVLPGVFSLVRVSYFKESLKRF